MSPPCPLFAAAKRGQGARGIIAADNDETGRRFGAQVESLDRETGREVLAIIRDRPPEGAVWNDMLKSRAAAQAAPRPDGQVGFREEVKCPRSHHSGACPVTCHRLQCLMICHRIMQSHGPD
jgi:hypothetical protein